MKRLLASLVLFTALATLSGCYYDPGYSYVRGSNYSGDVYYGQAAPVYQGGYGYPGYGYNDGYYGCCGVVGGFYGGYGGVRYVHRGYGGRGYYPGRYGYGGNHWQGRAGYANGHTGYRGGGRAGYQGARGGNTHTSHQGSSHRGGNRGSGH